MYYVESQYNYETIAPMGYDEWAEASVKAERVPVLPLDMALRMEELFSHEGPLSPVDYWYNVAWLKILETNIQIVWSAVQQKASGMLNISYDYRERFGHNIEKERFGHNIEKERFVHNAEQEET